MADIFQVGIEYDGGKGITQAKELGKTIEDAGEKGEKAGKRIAAGMGAGEEAAIRQIKQVQALRTALQQQVQLGESMSAAISRDRQMILQHSAALEQNTRIERDRTAAAHAAQVAIGEEHAAAIDRDRKMILLHTQALEDNTRRELANAAAVRSMALAQAEALAMDKARTAQQSLMGRAGAALGSLGIGAGALGGLAAVGAGVAILHKFVTETSESQAAMADLEAAVKSTGSAAGYSADQLSDMANELSKLTGFSDEAIERAQAMLLTFDKIRGETFPAAAAAVTDLARRMHGDLQGAAIQVGKALQDPDQGLTALRRSGISFSDAQTKVIKSLFDTGHAAQGQALILKELQKEVGGAAEAYRKTLGGALDNAKVQFGNLFEGSDESTKNIVRSINAIAEALPKISAALARMQKPGQWVFDLLGIGTPAAPPLGTSFLKTPPLVGAYLANLQGNAGKQPGGPDLAAIKDLLAERALEIDKQNALNAAYGKSDLVLKTIEIHYHALAELQKNKINHNKDEAAALDALTKKEETAALRQAELETGTLQLHDAQKRFNDLLPGLDQALKNSGVQLIKYDATHKAVGDTQAIVAARNITGINAQIKANEGQTAAEIAEDAKRIQAAQKYQDDLGNIWRTGIANIVTDGTKSFADFSQDVLRMFTSLLHRMEQEGKSSGALKLGIAGITGGLAGYGIGQQTGSMAGGFLGGAAAGALAGSSFGIPGAIIGGLAGAAGGLIGAGQVQREAAERLKQAAQSLHESITAYARESRNPVVSALQNELDRLAAARGVISATYPEGSGKDAEYAAELARLESAYKEHVLAISADFWNGITAQLNALDGPAGVLRNALDNVERAFNQNMEAATRLHASEEQLQQIRDLHDKSIQQLKDAEAERQHREELDKLAEAHRKAAEAAKVNADAQMGFYDRVLSASGQTELLFNVQQERARAKILEDLGAGVVNTTTAAWGFAALAAEKWQREQAQIAADAQKTRDAQREALQLQQQAADEAIRQQQQTLDWLKGSVDTLTKFSNSLKLDKSLSPLSPRKQYEEAQRQYETIRALAAGGDRTAIASLPDAAKAFLEQSRSFNASTVRYTQDFDRVQAFVDQIREQQSTQIPVQEKILAELQSQSAKLQQQITTLGSINSNVDAAPFDYVAEFKKWYELFFSQYQTIYNDDQSAKLTLILSELKKLNKDTSAPPPAVTGPGGGRPGGGGTGPGGDTAPAAWQLLDPYLGGIINVFPGADYVVDGAGNYWKGNPISHRGTWYDAMGVRNPDYQTPGYAFGGDFRGGVMRVGERGPELLATGPARVHTAQQLNADVVTELRTLRGEVRQLREKLVDATDRQTKKIEQTADAGRLRR